MKLLTTIVLATLTATAFAAPGTPKFCGVLAERAARMQEGRQMGLPEYANSGSAANYHDQTLQAHIDKRKAENKPMADDFIAFLRQGNDFTIRLVYQRSKSSSPASVGEYVNSMCLIDLD